MANFFCRALDCGMNLASAYQRDKHQNLMHKDWLKEAAFLLIEKINNSNTEEKLNKKVLKTDLGNFSYKQAKELMNDKDEIGKAILKTISAVIETYFAYNKDYGVKELLKISEFNIK